MRSVLAICWEMPPLSGPRAVQVTRTLVALGARGWRSRVICFDAQSNRYQQDYHVSIEQWSRGQARLLPVRSPEEWLFFRTLWRVVPALKNLPDEKRVWVAPAIAEGRRALAGGPADVIVSFAQPWSDHLVGLRLHRDTGLPWVAHFSDPWVDSPYQRGGSWVRRQIASMEHRVIAEATAVVFVNAHTRDRVMAKYPAAWRDRTAVIPQGYDATSVAGSGPGAEGPMRIVYTGRFYDGLRTPATFLHAVATLNRRRPIADRMEIEFVGSGIDTYERLAADLGIGAHVRFTGRLAPSQAQERAAGADVLLVIDAATDGPSLFLPSKLIDYLPLGKPILGLTPLEGPSADLIRELGYAPVDPADVAGTAAALDGLLDRHRTGTLAITPQHPAVAGRYDINETTAALDAVLEAAIKEPRR